MAGHDNNFDFLRFALATVVVVSHCTHALNRGAFDDDPLLGATSGQEHLGHIGVMGFFALSGCLVTASWQRSAGLVDYFKKRALRIYPGFVVAWLVCILIVAPLSGLTASQYAQNVHVGRWLLKMALLRGFGDVYAFPHNPMHMLNTVLWSIPIEFECYVLVAALGVLGLWRWPSVVLSLYAVSAVVTVLPAVSAGIAPLAPGLSALLAGSHRALARVTIWDELCFFAAGSTLYVYRKAIPFSPRLAAVCGVVLVAGARLPPLLTLAMPICGTYLLFYVAYNPHIKLHGFGKKADLSYGIYLYSWPVQQILVQHFERWLTPGLLFVATMPLAMAAALASWVCVEKPFLRLKRPRVPTLARGLPEGL